MDTKAKRGFASDNNAGAHPDILKELQKVNEGHAVGYGDDRYTREAEELFRIILGNDTETFFVFNGTAANIIGLSAVMRPWNSLIAASSAHIEQDECGAAEKFIGCKVLTVDTSDGKIDAGMVSKHLYGIDFEHHSQPRVVSITQATEMGTIYTPDEVAELAGFVHKNGMLLHMDGARLSNAAASLNVPFREFTTDAGVDLLSFGGTKNGLVNGEAICFLRPGLNSDFKYIRKQGMQLASKMRFISAQFIAYFRNDLWLRNASHANSMAKILEEGIRRIAGVEITQRVESNGIFVIIPHQVAERLRENYFFYSWNEATSEYRLMTSWDTRESDISGFLKQFEALMNEYNNS